MKNVAIAGIGLLGPGLASWAAARPILAGREAYAAGPVTVPPPAALPAAERRRVGLPVKLALAVGYAACENAACDPATVATVFTSSGGDGDNLHYLCETLAESPLDISPTRFHNSVHNAPAGYWSIAAHAQAPSTSLAARDGSFAAGLLVAMTQVLSTQAPVLLIAHDQPYPEPLHAVRPVAAIVAIALVLVPWSTGARARIGLLESVAAGSLTTMRDPATEALRATVPAARGLPLLEVLARDETQPVSLQYLDGYPLQVEVAACH